MTNIAAVARREADEAEREDELDPEHEGDTEPPAPTPAPQPTEPTEAQWKALGKENERHLGKVRQIMGPFVEDFEPCSTCDTVGIVPPGPKPPEVKTNSNFRRCDDCNGYGQVLTGSIREGREGVDCPGCGGAGYL